MHISAILQTEQPSFSFEFFPPRNEESSAALFESIRHLAPLKPSYISVTYGAGGSTRQLTHDLVVKLQKETNLTIIPHLTCVGSTKEEIFEILRRYSASGIENVMALRGDPPKGSNAFQPIENGFTHTVELVSFIKSNFPHFSIGVAGFPEGHPETPNRLKEIEFLKTKIDAGADYICSQLFFENRDFYDFCGRCELAGITAPVIAGIMPVTTQKGLVRMADLALGARFPAKLLRALSRVESDEAVERVGTHWATEQVRDLIDHNVRGIHFYTLNRSQSTVRIYETLGVRNSENLRSR